MKLKRRGFMLFEYYDRVVTGIEYCGTMKELKHKWWGELDDKWDMDGRNKIHYFYLNISNGRYYPLEKWKNNYDHSLVYDQCKIKELSTKIF